VSGQQGVIDPSAWPLEELGARYRAGVPFGHVVIDDFVPAPFLADLRAAFDDEPAEALQDEIFDVMASASPPEHQAFRRIFDRFTSPDVLAAVASITGEAVAGVELRAYAYLPGHYLLPHADRDLGGRRRVAYAFYVDLLDGTAGGELDLYACDLEGDEIARARVATTIAPRANRCVLFEVSDRSLHRVREITAGGRLSLAGWFTR
jgi:Rps23 Pro-64 3,4-dihydroxylase Tpa1-like proline 4-hydroxylase